MLFAMSLIMVCFLTRLLSPSFVLCIQCIAVSIVTFPNGLSDTLCTLKGASPNYFGSNNVMVTLSLDPPPPPPPLHNFTPMGTLQIMTYSYLLQQLLHRKLGCILSMLKVDRIRDCKDNSLAWPYYGEWPYLA